jgi:hypothetical protein
MQLQAARNLRGVLEGVVGKRHETLGEQPTVWRKEEAEKVGGGQCLCRRGLGPCDASGRRIFGFRSGSRCPIKVDVGTLNLNILGRELPLCIPGIPMSATVPSSVPKPPKYREPCDRDPSTDTRRSCKFLHPDQTELYAHLIPNLPWNAESESGPNDDEMEE